MQLKTVILIPRGAQRAPILLTRTPYGATERIGKVGSAHLSALIDSGDVADDAVVNGGYIRVVQDVRGKHDSQGDYLMNRPLQGDVYKRQAIARPGRARPAGSTKNRSAGAMPASQPPAAR